MLHQKSEKYNTLSCGPWNYCGPLERCQGPRQHKQESTRRELNQGNNIKTAKDFIISIIFIYLLLSKQRTFHDRRLYW